MCLFRCWLCLFCRQIRHIQALKSRQYLPALYGFLNGQGSPAADEVAGVEDDAVPLPRGRLGESAVADPGRVVEEGAEQAEGAVTVGKLLDGRSMVDVVDNLIYFF